MLRTLQFVVIASLAACATTPTRVVPPRCDLRDDCFNADRVRSYTPLDRDTLIVEVGPYRCPYLLEIDGIGCGLEFADRLVFRGDRQRFCALDGAIEVLDDFYRASPPAYCRIRVVRALSEDELLERYASSGRIAPPPPTGSGELRVEETSEGSGTGAPPDEAADRGAPGASRWPRASGAGAPPDEAADDTG